MAESAALVQRTAEVVFWTLLGLTIFVYVGYPALLALHARLFPRPWRRDEPATWPGVSIVIAVRNELRHLPGRLENLRALDYPAERVELIVVSDGSTDGTDEWLDRHAPDVRLVRVPEGGKALALNAGVAAARHPILVFGDARQRFAPDVLRRLVTNFSDPTVGGVSGELMLEEQPERGGDRGIAEGVGAYWRYEKWLRRRESLVDSTLGATGALYALRRELWKPLPAGTLLDDVLAPMRAVLGGHRVVFDETARVFDRPAADAATEHRRKRRTLAGNYQILWLEPRLLLPGVNPVWVQYVAHKVGRLVVPWALLGLLAANAVLVTASPLYAWLFAGQLAFYALAAYGGWLAARQRSGPAGAWAPRRYPDAARHVR